VEPVVVITIILAVTTIAAAVAWASRGRALDGAVATVDRLRDEAIT